MAEFPADVHVKDIAGFTCSVNLSAGLWEQSLATQKQWRINFQEEKERLAKMKKDMAAINNIRDPEMKQIRLQQLEDEPKNNISDLPDPILYPIDNLFPEDDFQEDQDVQGHGRSSGGGVMFLRRRPQQPMQPNDEFLGLGSQEEGQEMPMLLVARRTGLPNFKLIMHVDLQGRFGKEKSVTAFQNVFGTLPAAAMLEVTQMLFKSSRRQQQQQHLVELPKEIFLKDPVIMQHFTRLKTFQPEEINMDGFRKAGCDSHLYNRVIEVVRNCQDPVGKVHFLNDFYERVARQHVSSVLNKELRSSHALHQACFPPYFILIFWHMHNMHTGRQAYRHS